MIASRDPFFSACGLNCGLCPRFHTAGSSKCPGCGNEGFPAKHPACGVLSCAVRKEIMYCYECGNYPCPKYANAHYDSFITHQNMRSDFEKAKTLGIDAYQIILTSKMAILRQLLSDYHDGRQKSFFCLAVNLLALQDLQSVMAQIAIETATLQTIKEKAAVVAALLHRMGEKRGISLKLMPKKQAQKSEEGEP